VIIMSFTDIGKSGCAISLGSYTGDWWCAVGTGSKAVDSTRSGLVTQFDRNAITGSPNYSTINKILFTGDFNSSEMSGATLTEFGIFDLTSGGQAWQVEGFSGCNFDGTQELQVETTWRVF
jgi:hypothetical protein